MPLLDHRQLQDREERILAYVILTFIANGYVWQDRPHNVAKVYTSTININIIYMGLSEKYRYLICAFYEAHTRDVVIYQCLFFPA